ncbi:helix-turn-helix domain-containing protein [Calothrix sp. NIES-3974]|uniref:helix-turn-helix domain-containing protein n=1 Tax=Calothrix sp. NIES-3974 TaxID=2005462 RepID=UPI000B60EE99|nr:AraC family transcriptional regulator [Calothrix sp. NIES-3974]BAZ05614.1 AraC family transcriptional regulator [Calothrix sp. NIES-3974]
MESQANLSSQKRGWENILVEQYQVPKGEAICYDHKKHTIYLSLAPRPVSLYQVREKQSYRGFYRKGDIAITPADMSIFCRWERDDRFLQISISSAFVDTVARETMERENLELIPCFRTKDSQLEAIAMMLLTELQQENTASHLYVESLANLLAIHLIRQYATSKPHLAIREGGLPPYQLTQVLEYINAHLDRNVKLADLAPLLNMSKYHFSHAFQQSMGIPPYQYLLQQRIERAKLLLKQTERYSTGVPTRSLAEIALDCGFSSHSHFTKQFRQFTGMTPTAYRLTV